MWCPWNRLPAQPVHSRPRARRQASRSRPSIAQARAGGAWAGDKNSVTGTFLPTATAFVLEGVDNRFGWTAGAGVEWAFAELWSARLEYDYYGLGQRSALMTDPINGFTGVMNVQQSVQTVKLGVSFHMWAGQ